MAGSLSAGMDCASTTTGATSVLTLDETLAFLQPTEARAGAICMSAQDYSALKTTIEQACRKLRGCATEQVITILSRLDSLQAKTQAKRGRTAH